MRRLFTFIAATFLLSFIPKSAQPPLTDAERKSAISFLEETQQNLENTLAGLSDAQLHWKPADSVWNAAECLEHITLSEENIFQWCMSVVDQPADPSKQAEHSVSDDAVKAMVSSRDHKVKTNAQLTPSGSFGDLAATMAEFKKRRAKTIDYVKTTDADMRNHFTQSPLGLMDSYQIILFLTAHSKRHTAQIEELKNNPAFPKS